MSLRAAKIQPPEFQRIRNHLVSHKPNYSTMHLRQVRYRNKKRGLRYLHAMYTAPTSPDVIEGVISGPDVFWHYQLVNTAVRTQLNVFVEHGSDKDLDRIGERFLPEILSRVAEEQTSVNNRPRYLPGQFYLRRKPGGVSATHPKCQLALKQAVLDKRFVSKLAAWDLELICP